MRTTSAPIWTLLLLLAVVSAAATGCSGGGDARASDDGSSDGAQTASNTPDDGTKKKGDKDEEPKEEAVPVEVEALERGAIESVLRFSSNLEAEDQVGVFSEAARRVTALLVEEGDRVRKGQVLMRLQDEEQKSALAKVRSQYDKAAREYERQKRLYAQELISEQAFLDATYELEQLEISVTDAERELGYAEVRAPISGTITKRLVNLGDQVQLGQHLFDLVDFDSMVARIYVPEKHLGELRQGLVARVTPQVAGGRQVEASVDRIAPTVDPRSGTVKVTVDVGGRPGMLPGMYVDVELVTDTRDDAVLVPKRALIYDNDQTFVYRLTDDSRVERVFVVPAVADKFNVSPLDGLERGDRVVVAGQAGLKDGALVELPGVVEKDSSQLEAADEPSDADPVVERASR